VRQVVAQQGWQVANVDTVVVAERPKLKPHIPAMQARLAAALGVTPSQVGVKATTNEGLGPVGREEGIAAYAVALLVPLPTAVA
jgi:2-C-methyl-D-erythritol 2,4-cyclodiphosphate synthase